MKSGAGEQLMSSWSKADFQVIVGNKQLLDN
jgi:hypothetical protein